MDESHSRTRVEGGEQVVLTVLAEVDTRRVGQQDDAVGVQFVKGPHHLGDGFVDVWHRNGGEETEPIGSAATTVRPGSR